MQISLRVKDPVETALDRFASLPETCSLLAEYRVQYNHPGRALRRLGLFLWGESNFPLARDALLAAQAADPDNIDLWRDLAGVYIGMNHEAAAETCLQTLLARDPAWADAWVMLAEQQSKRGALARAEYSYQQAVLIDPLLANAHFGLGIIFFQRKKYDAAGTALKACVMLEPANIVAHICLGHVLYLTGDFAGSAVAFAIAAPHGMLDQGARRKYAQAATLQAIIGGDIDGALSIYTAIAGDDGESIDKIALDSFSLLSGFGYIDAARALGAKRLAKNPGDFVQRYLLDAISGAKLTASPLDYLEEYFDGFAPTFERQLVETLDYHVPEQLAAMAANAIENRQRVGCSALDLGCGTGLVGQYLTPFCDTLIGIDIAGRMLAEAEKRGVYQSLIKTDVAGYLSRNHQSFDIVAAADFLIYCGELSGIIQGVHQSLKPGGVFVFNVELSDSNADDYAILPSGRFSHQPAYIAAALAHLFTIERSDDTIIRLEANRPVKGQLIVARRKD